MLLNAARLVRSRQAPLVSLYRETRRENVGASLASSWKRDVRGFSGVESAESTSSDVAPKRKLADHAVITQTNHLMIVNKPVGMSSQPDATSHGRDLISMVRRYLQVKFKKTGNAYVGSVHRLDKAASGLMVIGKTSKATARLHKFFQEGKVEKEYLAVVDGELNGRGIIKGGTSYADYWSSGKRKGFFPDRSLGRSRHSKPDGDLEWNAIRRVVSLERANESRPDYFTLLAIRIKTGRKHQIRRQLACAGFPILGDSLYGSHHKVTFSGQVGDKDTILLHASSLKFPNPVLTDQVDLKRSRGSKKVIKATVGPPRFWRLAYKNMTIPALESGQSYFDLNVNLAVKDLTNEQDSTHLVENSSDMWDEVKGN